jgi:hypothetical protein
LRPVRIVNIAPGIGRASVLAMPSASFPGFVIHSAYDLVFKHDAFRIVHQEPLIGKVRVCKHLEMVTVADLFAGINVNPNRLHRSRASLRRPQWGLFRDELNSRTWPRFNARIMPIRANIVGAAKIGNQEQRFHGRLPFGGIVLGLGKRGDVSGRIAQRSQRAAVRQDDWIIERRGPRH